MQMNGNGIICSGYFYYNPKVVDYGTIRSSSNITRSFSPAIGETPKLKLENSNSSGEYIDYTITFGGTYVSPTRVGSNSYKAQSFFSAGGTASIEPGLTRYA